MHLNETRLEKVKVGSKAILENLMSIYLHDLSEFADDLKINGKGRFEYDGIDLYFESEDLTPYFIIYKDEIAGFVLLNKGTYVEKHIDYVINELFVLNGFRNKGIGSDAIRILLDEYKGKYKIVQISMNKTAVNFWTKFYEKQGVRYIKSKEKIDDLDCNVQVFNV